MYDFADTTPLPVCIHCRRALAMPRRRGLCDTCYARTNIRSMYPPERRGRQSRFAYEDESIFTDIAADEPTTALPGSIEKIAILKARAQFCLPLFHPDDFVPDRR